MFILHSKDQVHVKANSQNLRNSHTQDQQVSSKSWKKKFKQKKFWGLKNMPYQKHVLNFISNFLTLMQAKQQEQETVVRPRKLFRKPSFCRTCLFDICVLFNAFARRNQSRNESWILDVFHRLAREIQNVKDAQKRLVDAGLLNVSDDGKNCWLPTRKAKQLAGIPQDDA